MKRLTIVFLVLQIIITCFGCSRDPALLQQDNALYAIINKGRTAKDDWVEFVCPSRTAYRTSEINEAADLVSKLEPDGLSV